MYFHKFQLKINHNHVISYHDYILLAISCNINISSFRQEPKRKRFVPVQIEGPSDDSDT